MAARASDWHGRGSDSGAPGPHTSHHKDTGGGDETYGASHPLGEGKHR